MPAAQRSQIVDVGTSVVAPEHDVVNLALIERHLTAASDAGAVHRSQFSPLGPIDGALGAAEVPHHSVGVDAGERDLGVAELNRAVVSTGSGTPADVSQIPWSW